MMKPETSGDLYGCTPSAEWKPALCASPRGKPQPIAAALATIRNSQPCGAVTAHTDHSMAGIFATLAFQWAGRSNRYPDQIREHTSPHRTQKLYYSTTDFTLPGRQPITVPPSTAVIDIGDGLESKIAAFKAHNTQAPLWPIFEGNVRQRGRMEMFHLAAAVKPMSCEMETDLFAGIDENL